MKTYADLFSGGGLATVGAMAAGYTPIWGVEYSPAIADVHRANIPGKCFVSRVEDVDPMTLYRPDHLHASPPCPNFSVAKPGGKETEEDISMAEAVCHFLRVLTPETFTLENVRGYRRSCSYRLICDTLDALDYWFTSQVLNAADTGVSQTRERLFIIACREGFPPPLPTPTPWTGWYAAIEDLLPTLPESRFAPWQLKRLPEYLMSFLHPHTTADGSTPVRGVEEPAFAIQSTISKAISKAFIVEGSAAGEDNKFNLPVRKADEPVFTMRGSQNNPRAFLVDCQNNGNAETAGERGLTNRQSAEPSHTITGSQNKRTVRAWLEQGRVVIMTPRALGRFQSLPDWYELPTGKGANKVACVVIGNGVPCRLMETILRGLT